jgi:universal stress protein E
MSPRQKRILAYLEPNAKNGTLLSILRRLALRNGSEVLALRVLREFPWYARVGVGGSKEIRTALSREAAAALEGEVQLLVRAGVKVQTRVTWGRPFAVIIREALRRSTWLVMKTAHGGANRDSRLFGSTAMHLLRKCPVPVWIVKPHRSARVRRVLAAVDPVRPISGGRDFSADILALASEIAAGENAELHVCHAYAVAGEHLLHSPLPPGYREYIGAIRENIEESMNALLAPLHLRTGDAQVHILEGDAEHILTALSAELPAELLVMGTIGRTGVKGLLIGETAERVLRRANCSVLALKPRGFRSPLDPKA